MSCKDKLGNTCTHVVRVFVYYITSTDKGIAERIKLAHKTYGQYGIKIQIIFTRKLALTKEQQKKLKVINGDCNWDKQNDEQNLLFGLVGSGSNQKAIRAFFVNYIVNKNGISIGGCGAHKPGKPAFLIEQKYIKSTFSHELGHVLLTSKFRPVHSKDSKNVMFENATTAKLPKLTTKQIEAIKKSKYCKPC